MEIKTKLDVDQNAYFMQDNKIQTKAIKHIQINVSLDAFLNTEVNVKYTVNENSITMLYESEVFATKQDLLNSL